MNRIQRAKEMRKMQKLKKKYSWVKPYKKSYS